MVVNLYSAIGKLLLFPVKFILEASYLTSGILCHYFLYFEMQLNKHMLFFTVEEKFFSLWISFFLCLLGGHWEDPNPEIPHFYLVWNHNLCNSSPLNRQLIVKCKHTWHDIVALNVFLYFPPVWVWHASHVCMTVSPQTPQYKTPDESNCNTDDHRLSVPKLKKMSRNTVPQSINSQHK